MKRRQRKPDKGAAKWLVTYSDMITLILVFFILLFSMSRIDQIKFEAVAESFQNREVLDFLPSVVPNSYPQEGNNTAESGKDESDDPIDVNVSRDAYISKQQEEESLNELVESVEAYLDEHALNDEITAAITERGVLLVLQDSIFFNMGEAVILDEGKPFLEEIGSLFSQMPNDIKVEGHTDTRPINTYRYPSNWELSGARASSVVRYLIEEFNLEESRFSIAGYGDTRQVAPNDSEENMSLNRRVEITILNTDYEDE
ncbi:flagellar motor protein MotS [Oceanobacillus alkalisoli]|uniref:flagellar motor protein MotS n=1 Tax=Oceanobacillus alkalisoli TaxID=2925113 RepID=UPI001EE48680|nr:flagellar motor protein MotS [Oceanobacillus alkalisoli]MCG5103831.1 flagellar motor protein MotB [Oceanobacillus alkalisoli]